MYRKFKFWLLNTNRTLAICVLAICYGITYTIGTALVVAIITFAINFLSPLMFVVIGVSILLFTLVFLIAKEQIERWERWEKW